jgi:hypothetical protein
VILAPPPEIFIVSDPVPPTIVVVVVAPSNLRVPQPAEPKAIVPLKLALAAISKVELLPMSALPLSAPVIVIGAPGEGLGADPVTDPEKLVIVIPAELVPAEIVFAPVPVIVTSSVPWPIVILFAPFPLIVIVSWPEPAVIVLFPPPSETLRRQSLAV